MFPGVYGFTWDAGNIIFLGVFFTVAIAIAATVTLASIRAIRDMKRQKAESIRWHEDFHDLPVPLRACRHELAGEIPQRTCPNAFDCRACDLHPAFLERKPAGTATSSTAFLLGLDIPLDRLYHRGHTWVKQESDGTYLIGLDDFAARVFGNPDQVVLPDPGKRLQVNGTAWSMQRKGDAVRILSPVDGEVVEQGSREKGWMLRVRPLGEELVTTHLLQGEEVVGWLLRELERLQMRLGYSGVGPALADGGELVKDLPSQYPAMEWDTLWGESFLEP